MFQIPFSCVLYPVSHLGYSGLGYRVFRQKKTKRSKWRMKSIPKLQNCLDEQSRYSHRTQVLTSNYCDSGTSEAGMAMRSVVNFRSLFAPDIASGYLEVFLKYYISTRQSEIILECPRKNSSNPSLNCRSLFRNVKRFQF